MCAYIIIQPIPWCWKHILSQIVTNANTLKQAHCEYTFDMYFYFLWAHCLQLKLLGQSICAFWRLALGKIGPTLYSHGKYIKMPFHSHILQYWMSLFFLITVALLDKTMLLAFHWLSPSLSLNLPFVGFLLWIICLCLLLYYYHSVKSF